MPPGARYSLGAPDCSCCPDAWWWPLWAAFTACLQPEDSSLLCALRQLCMAVSPGCASGQSFLKSSAQASWTWLAAAEDFPAAGVAVDCATADWASRAVRQAPNRRVWCFISFLPWSIQWTEVSGGGSARKGLLRAAPAAGERVTRAEKSLARSAGLGNRGR